MWKKVGKLLNAQILLWSETKAAESKGKQKLRTRKKTVGYHEDLKPYLSTTYTAISLYHGLNHHVPASFKK